jgi:hypothetical protein
MSRASSQRRRKPFTALLLGAAAILTAAAKSDDRIQLLPQLQNGDTLRYESHARLKRSVKTKSNVLTMFEAKPLLADFSTNLQLFVQDFHTMDRRPMLAAETQLLTPETVTTGDAAPRAVRVDFAIGGDGALIHADGLDDLEPEQRLAWQFWIAQFAFGWTLPDSGVKPGEKWKSKKRPRRSPISFGSAKPLTSRTITARFFRVNSAPSFSPPRRSDKNQIRKTRLPKITSSTS